MSSQFLDLHVKCGSFSCKSGHLVAHSVRSQLTLSLLELKPKCGLCAQDNLRGSSLSSIKHLLSTNTIGSFELFEPKKMHLKMKVSCQWDGDVKMESIKVQNNTQRNVDKKHDLGESADCSHRTSLPGIIYPPLRTVGKSTNIMWQECMVKKHDREKMLGQKGCVVWITGLSGSGKSTVACTLDHALLSKGRLSYVLDGDNLRHGLNKNLGFSGEDRAENIRRVGEVAKLFADAGVICIASFISPYRKDRDACREIMGPGDFIEVYLNIPLRICEQRDPKGLYKLARAGKIKGFTGVDDPYEEPSNCEIVLEPRDNILASPEAMAGKIIAYLEKKGYLGP